jgi:hypothetical protein
MLNKFLDNLTTIFAFVSLLGIFIAYLLAPFNGAF